MVLNQLNGFVFLLCSCSSCRRLHQFWKSCRESRSSWKVSRNVPLLYLILTLRRAADERRPLSCLSVINAIMDHRGNPDLSRTVSSAGVRASRAASRDVRAAHRGGGATPNSRRTFRSTDRESSLVWPVCPNIITSHFEMIWSDCWLRHELMFLMTFSEINICTFLFLQTNLDGDFSRLWLWEAAEFGIKCKYTYWFFFIFVICDGCYGQIIYMII